MNTDYTMVRILPMDKKVEFKNYDVKELQRFLVKKLVIKEEVYHYKKSGMNIDLNKTLVLFQFDNKIVACGKLLYRKKLEVPVDNIYHGFFRFDKKSIQIFEPLSNEQINKCFSCLIKFGQVKHFLNVKKVNRFFNLVCI